MTYWFLYLVRTRTGALYTGISTDVDRRFAEHQAGRPKGARSLWGKGPLELVFHEAVGDRSRATRLEYAVKQWPRSRKDALVGGHLKLSDIELD